MEHDGMLCGGITEQSTDAGGFQQEAEFVLRYANKLEKLNKDGLQKQGALKVVKVLSASTQVVAGIMYRLDILMADEGGRQYKVRAAVVDLPYNQEHLNEIGCPEGKEMNGFSCQLAE